MLLLILGSPPPVTIQRQGLRDITEAIAEQLPQVLAKTGAADERLDDLVKRIPEVVSWITWAEVETVVARQLSPIKIENPSLRHGGAPGHSGVHGNRHPLLSSTVAEPEDVG